MKNSKKLLVLVPALGLFLSGCSFQEVKHSIGESWVGQHILHPIYDPIKNLIKGDKKEEQKAGDTSKPAEGSSQEGSQSGSQTEGGQSGGQGGQTGETDTVFEDIVSKIKPVASSFSGKAESALVVLDYYSLTQDATYDYVTHNKDGLKFAFTDYYNFSEDDTFETVYNRMLSELPSDATLVDSLSTEYLDYNYCFVVYEAGDYYYNVFAAVSGSYLSDLFAIVPKAQFDAYKDKVFESGSGEEEGGEEEGGEEEGGDVETTSTFELEKVKAALGITEDFPVPSGTSFDSEYGEGYATVTVHGGDMSAWYTALDGAGFVAEYESVEGFAYLYAEKGDLTIMAMGDDDEEYEISFEIWDDSYDSDDSDLDFDF